MNFIELPPRIFCNNPINQEKISIRHRLLENNKYYLCINIGSSICEYLKVNIGNKINIYYDENNKYIALLKKSDSNSGYTLSKYAKKGSAKIQMTWTPSVLHGNGKKREIKHDFYEDGVLIYLDSNLQ